MKGWNILTKMSVIVITPDNYATIRRLMTCLAKQSISRQLEIVIIAAAGFCLEDPEIAHSFGSVHIEITAGIRSFAATQALGVHLARSPVVAFTEDHSLPDPLWAENLLHAHEKGHAAVGPAVINGNPRSLVSCANFAIEYGQWADPLPAQTVPHLPGHNSSYKRDVLLPYRDELHAWLRSESTLHWDLLSKGHRLWLESSAKTAHHNFSDLFSTVRLRFCCGKIFAGSRSRTWPYMKRLLWFSGSPLIPFVRFYRVVRCLRQPGHPGNLLPGMFPAILLFLILDGMGEMAGYSSGIGKAEERMTEMEFHRERYMNPDDRLSFSLE